MSTKYFYKVMIYRKSNRELVAASPRITESQIDSTASDLMRNRSTGEYQVRIRPDSELEHQDLIMEHLYRLCATLGEENVLKVLMELQESVAAARSVAFEEGYEAGYKTGTEQTK